MYQRKSLVLYLIGIDGFHIAINDDDVVGDYSHIGWTGQAHHEYTYGTLTLDGPAGPVTPLRIVENMPDLTSGNLVLRWDGGKPPFQVEKAGSLPGTFQPVGAAQTVRTLTDTGALTSAARSFYRIRESSAPAALAP